MREQLENADSSEQAEAASELIGEYEVRADRAQIEAIALADEAVRRFVTSAPKKIIVVPGRLVNVVA